MNGKPLFLLLCLMAIGTYAQCTKDVDCKGDRICVDGKCVDPTPPTTQPANTSAKVTDSAWISISIADLNKFKFDGFLPPKMIYVNGEILQDLTKSFRVPVGKTKIGLHPTQELATLAGYTESFITMQCSKDQIYQVTFTYMCKEKNDCDRDEFFILVNTYQSSIEKTTYTAPYGMYLYNSNYTVYSYVEKGTTFTSNMIHIDPKGRVFYVVTYNSKQCLILKK